MSARPAISSTRGPSFTPRTSAICCGSSSSASRSSASPSPVPRRARPWHATLRSHRRTVEVRLSGALHPGEIVIALAAAAQGRPQQRLAALSTEQ
ncbi:amino acid synthesis family protein [Streptomyces sp. B21-108]